MAAYADLMEENGAIIALDQEKAYDKIKHKYLFNTLEAFKIPPTYINTIKNLYKSAYTHVTINGFLSSPFKVTRGVRQGDPLSCLLFDLAIEPLACSLRNSPKLRGYNIPGLEDRIIVNMYADDTTIYLSKEDRYSDLEDILKKWCLASGAKFNLEKTEVLPIGTKTHRENVVADRKLNAHDNPWTEQIRIARDGNPIRTLGAWIGNEINNVTTWEPVLGKIEKTLKRWNLCHPSLDGKRLIVQMVIGGMTQFLTKAQGMPKSIETALKKTICTFIWEERRNSPIGIAHLERPISEGGLDLLNISARNEAIKITWIKEYMDLTRSRPAWAYTTDAIINTLKPNGIRDNNDITAFLTSWDPPSRGKRANRLPKIITNMLSSAHKHNVSFAPLKLSHQLKNQMPAWLHLGAPPKTYHKLRNECLQTTHKVKSVKNLKEAAERLTHRETHHTTAACLCNECLEDRLKGCKNPDMCARTAQ